MMPKRRKADGSLMMVTNNNFEDVKLKYWMKYRTSSRYAFQLKNKGMDMNRIGEQALFEPQLC